MKKGFTLVELLAVIVVLAIISVIVAPLVMKAIEKSKIGALRDSAYGLIDSAELYLVNNQSDMSDKTIFTFVGGEQTSDNKLSYKGKIDNGKVILYTNSKIAVCIDNGEYAAIKKTTEEEVNIIAGSCGEENTTGDGFDIISTVEALQKELDELKSQGTATSSDILKDKTAVVNGILVTGTMANNGIINSSVNSGESYTIPTGYTSGGTIVALEKTLQQKTFVRSMTANGNSQITVTFDFPTKVVGIESISISNTQMDCLGVWRISNNVYNFWMHTGLGLGTQTGNVTIVATGY